MWEWPASEEEGEEVRETSGDPASRSSFRFTWREKEKGETLYGGRKRVITGDQKKVSFRSFEAKKLRFFALCRNSHADSKLREK